MFEAVKAAITGTSRLTSSEESRLVELKATVKRGISAWQAAAAALAEIRDKQLYRATHRSFGAFCEAEFDLSERRIRQLTESWDIVQSLRPPVDMEAAAKAVANPPTIPPLPPLDQLSDRAARELRPLPPAERLEALREAAAATGSAPTAPQVREAVRRRTGKPALKPKRFLVPGWSIVATPNRKASGTVREALQAALAQLDQAEHATAKKAA
jgi:hypothetical protein